MNRFQRLTLCATLLAVSIVPVMSADQKESLPPDTNLFGDLPPDAGTPSTVSTVSESQAKEDPYEHTVSFQDHHSLRGRLVGITADSVIWLRPESREPLRFAREAIRRIDLIAPADVFSDLPPYFPPRDASTPILATVKVGGADWLFGRLTSPDGQHFTLQFSDGIRLSLAKPQVEWIYFGPHPAPACGFFGSPLDVVEWAPVGFGSHVRDGVLEITRTNWLGHATYMPKRFEIDFDVPSESEDWTRLSLTTGAPSPVHTPGSVDVLFSHKEVSHNLSAFNAGQTMAQEPPAEGKGGELVRYRLFYDGPAVRLHVWRNEREIGDWNLTAKEDLTYKPPGSNVGMEFPGVEYPWRKYSAIEGVCFERSPNPNDIGPHFTLPPLKFRHLSVQPWSGVFPGATETHVIDDVFSRRQAKLIEGHLESIDTRTVVLSGVGLSQEDNALLRFSHTPEPLTKPEARLQLGRQGECNVRHLILSGGQLHGETAFSTAFEMPASEVKSIVFSETTSPPAKADDVLVFQNGDELPGHLIGASLPGSVRWKPTWGAETKLETKRIAGIRLGIDRQRALPHATTVLLSTGERLRGQIVAFDERQLQLQHDRLGLLTLGRQRLARLIPQPALEPLDGGDQPEEWSWLDPFYLPLEHVGWRRQAWTYLDGTYVMRPHNVLLDSAELDPCLQREITPRLSCFELRAECTFPLSAADAAIELYRNGHRIVLIPGNGMFVVFTPEGLIAQQYEPKEFKMPAQKKRRVRFRVFVDLKTQSFGTFMEGTGAAHGRWQSDPNEATAKYSVKILPYSQGSTLNIVSGLWIGPWNGKIPEGATGDSAATTLANGDVVPEAPKAWHDGKWMLNHDSKDTAAIPSERIVKIEFGTARVLDRSPGRIRLDDGSTINVDSFQWDGSILSAHSATLGDLHLPAESVAELVYRQPAWRETPLPEMPPRPHLSVPNTIVP